MSTTYITNLAASRIVDAVTGQPVFVGPLQVQPVFALWAETYESNVHPRTPSWSLHHIGDKNSTMAFVLRSAAGCEGRMLRYHKESHTPPERLVRRWRQALSAPSIASIHMVAIRFGPSYRELDAKCFGAIRTILERYPASGATCSLEHGLSIDTNKPGAWDVICELVARSTDTSVFPWRVFPRSKPPAGEFYEAMGLPVPAAPRRSRDVTCRGRRVPRVFDVYAALQADSSLLETTKASRSYLAIYLDGTAHVGWPCELIDRFARGRAISAELAEPGVAERLISAARERIRQATLLPSNAVLTIPRPTKPGTEASAADWDLLSLFFPSSQAVQAEGEAPRLEVRGDQLLVRENVRVVMGWFERAGDAKAFISGVDDEPAATIPIGELQQSLSDETATG